MEFKDYYAIMGVSPEASADEIKRAYRKLARKYHPDVSKEPNAEAKFKELGEAYEVLKDPEKKSAYDRLRQQGWRGGEQFQAPPNWQQQFHEQRGQAGQDSVFSDFFESLFGGYAASGRARGFHQRQAQRGEDIFYVMEISPKDSYSGTSRVIEIPITEVSDGRLVQRNRSIQVKIPKGVIEGQQIRLKGQGGPGFQNGPAGDLYLEIHFRPEEPFHLTGRDVTLILPVTPWEAALGAKLRTPTLGGNIDLKIPANSQAGSKLRLKGRGLPGKVPGDQYVVLQIVNPPTIDDQGKRLFEDMAEKLPFNPRERLGV